MATINYFSLKMTRNFTKGLKWEIVKGFIEHLRPPDPNTPEGEAVRKKIGLSKQVYHAFWNHPELYWQVIQSYALYSAGNSTVCSGVNYAPCPEHLWHRYPMEMVWPPHQPRTRKEWYDEEIETVFNVVRRLKGIIEFQSRAIDVVSSQMASFRPAWLYDQLADFWETFEKMEMIVAAAVRRSKNRVELYNIAKLQNRLLIEERAGGISIAAEQLDTSTPAAVRLARGCSRLIRRLEDIERYLDAFLNVRDKRTEKDELSEAFARILNELTYQTRANARLEMNRFDLSVADNQLRLVIDFLKKRAWALQRGLNAERTLRVDLQKAVHKLLKNNELVEAKMLRQEREWKARYSRTEKNLLDTLQIYSSKMREMEDELDQLRTNGGTKDEVAKLRRQLENERRLNQELRNGQKEAKANAAALKNTLQTVHRQNVRLIRATDHYKAAKVMRQRDQTARNKPLLIKSSPHSERMAVERSSGGRPQTARAASSTSNSSRGSVDSLPAQGVEYNNDLSDLGVVDIEALDEEIKQLRAWKEAHQSGQKGQPAYKDAALQTEQGRQGDQKAQPTYQDAEVQTEQAHQGDQKAQPTYKDAAFQTVQDEQVESGSIPKASDRLQTRHIPSSTSTFSIGDYHHEPEPESAPESAADSWTRFLLCSSKEALVEHITELKAWKKVHEDDNKALRIFQAEELHVKECEIDALRADVRNLESLPLLTSEQIEKLVLAEELIRNHAEIAGTVADLEAQLTTCQNDFEALTESVKGQLEAKDEYYIGRYDAREARCGDLSARVIQLWKENDELRSALCELDPNAKLDGGVSKQGWLLQRVHSQLLMAGVERLGHVIEGKDDLIDTITMRCNALGLEERERWQEWQECDERLAVTEEEVRALKATIDRYEDYVGEQVQELDELQARIDELEDELASQHLNDGGDDLQETVSRQESELTQVYLRVDDVEAQNSSLRRTIDQREVEIVELQEKLNAGGVNELQETISRNEAGLEVLNERLDHEKDTNSSLNESIEQLESRISGMQMTQDMLNAAKQRLEQEKQVLVDRYVNAKLEEDRWADQYFAEQDKAKRLRQEVASLKSELDAAQIAAMEFCSENIILREERKRVSALDAADRGSATLTSDDPRTPLGRHEGASDARPRDSLSSAIEINILPNSPDSGVFPSSPPPDLSNPLLTMRGKPSYAKSAAHNSSLSRATGQMQMRKPEARSVRLPLSECSDSERERRVDAMRSSPFRFDFKPQRPNSKHAQDEPIPTLAELLETVRKSQDAVVSTPGHTGGMSEPPQAPSSAQREATTEAPTQLSFGERRKAAITASAEVRAPVESNADMKSESAAAKPVVSAKIDMKSGMMQKQASSEAPSPRSPVKLPQVASSSFLPAMAGTAPAEAVNTAAVLANGTVKPGDEQKKSSASTDKAAEISKKASSNKLRRVGSGLPVRIASAAAENTVMNTAAFVKNGRVKTSSEQEKPSVQSVKTSVQPDVEPSKDVGELCSGATAAPLPIEVVKTTAQLERVNNIKTPQTQTSSLPEPTSSTVVKATGLRKVGTMANLKARRSSAPSVPELSKLRGAPSLANIKDNLFMKADDGSFSRAAKQSTTEDRSVSGVNSQRVNSGGSVKSRAKAFMGIAQAESRSVLKTPLVSPPRSRAVSEGTRTLVGNVSPEFAARLEAIHAPKASASGSAPTPKSPIDSSGSLLSELTVKKLRPKTSASRLPIAVPGKRQISAALNSAPWKPSPLANAFQFPSQTELAIENPSESKQPSSFLEVNPHKSEGNPVQASGSADRTIRTLADELSDTTTTPTPTHTVTRKTSRLPLKSSTFPNSKSSASSSEYIATQSSTSSAKPKLAARSTSTPKAMPTPPVPGTRECQFASNHSKEKAKIEAKTDKVQDQIELFGQVIPPSSEAGHRSSVISELMPSSPPNIQPANMSQDQRTYGSTDLLDVDEGTSSIYSQDDTGLRNAATVSNNANTRAITPRPGDTGNNAVTSSNPRSDTTVLGTTAGSANANPTMRGTTPRPAEYGNNIAIGSNAWYINTTFHGQATAPYRAHPTMTEVIPRPHPVGTPVGYRSPGGGTPTTPSPATRPPSPKFSPNHSARGNGNHLIGNTRRGHAQAEQPYMPELGCKLSGRNPNHFRPGRPGNQSYQAAFPALREREESRSRNSRLAIPGVEQDSWPHGFADSARTASQATNGVERGEPTTSDASRSVSESARPLSTRRESRDLDTLPSQLARPPPPATSLKRQPMVQKMRGEQHQLGPALTPNPRGSMILSSGNTAKLAAAFDNRQKEAATSGSAYLGNASSDVARQPSGLSSTPVMGAPSESIIDRQDPFISNRGSPHQALMAYGIDSRTQDSHGNLIYGPAGDQGQSRNPYRNAIRNQETQEDLPWGQNYNLRPDANQYSNASDHQELIQRGRPQAPQGSGQRDKDVPHRGPSVRRGLEMMMQGPCPSRQASDRGHDADPFGGGNANASGSRTQEQIPPPPVNAFSFSGAAQREATAAAERHRARAQHATRPPTDRETRRIERHREDAYNALTGGSSIDVRLQQKEERQPQARAPEMQGPRGVGFPAADYNDPDPYAPHRMDTFVDLLEHIEKKGQNPGLWGKPSGVVQGPDPSRLEPKKKSVLGKMKKALHIHKNPTARGAPPGHRGGGLGDMVGNWARKASNVFSGKEKNAAAQTEKLPDFDEKGQQLYGSAAYQKPPTSFSGRIAWAKLFGRHDARNISRPLAETRNPPAHGLSEGMRGQKSRASSLFQSRLGYLDNLARDPPRRHASFGDSQRPVDTESEWADENGSLNDAYFEGGAVEDPERPVSRASTNWGRMIAEGIEIHGHWDSDTDEVVERNRRKSEERKAARK